MIRDLHELRRNGQVRRRVTDLTVPIEQWRAEVRAFSRRCGFRVRTGVVQLLELFDPCTRQVRVVPVVFAVRIDGRDFGNQGCSRIRPSRWDRPPPALGTP